EQDAAHLDRMRDERLPGVALLVAVRLVGEVERGADAIAIDLRGAFFQLGQQGGAQLGVTARAVHGSRSPFSLSWRRVVPFHSLRVGTNSSAQRPARRTASASPPRPK